MTHVLMYVQLGDQLGDCSLCDYIVIAVLADMFFTLIKIIFITHSQDITARPGLSRRL